MLDAAQESAKSANEFLGVRDQSSMYDFFLNRSKDPTFLALEFSLIGPQFDTGDLASWDSIEVTHPIDDGLIEILPKSDELIEVPAKEAIWEIDDRSIERIASSAAATVGQFDALAIRSEILGSREGGFIEVAAYDLPRPSGADIGRAVEIQLESNSGQFRCFEVAVGLGYERIDLETITTITDTHRQSDDDVAASEVYVATTNPWISSAVILAGGVLVSEFNSRRKQVSFRDRIMKRMC